MDIIPLLSLVIGVPAIVVMIGGYVVKLVVDSSVKATIDHQFSRSLESHKSELSRSLESHKSDLSRELERTKFTLKVSEVFFSKQMEALTKLRRFYRNLLPPPAHPDMDYDEAIEGMMEGITAHGDAIDELLCEYEVVMPKDVVILLNQACSFATEGRFQFYYDRSVEDPMATNDGIKTGKKFFETVEEAVVKLQAAIDSHAFSKS